MCSTIWDITKRRQSPPRFLTQRQQLNLHAMKINKLTLRKCILTDPLLNVVKCYLLGLQSSLSANAPLLNESTAHVPCVLLQLREALQERSCTVNGKSNICLKYLSVPVPEELAIAQMQYRCRYSKVFFLDPSTGTVATANYRCVYRDGRAWERQGIRTLH